MFEQKSESESLQYLEVLYFVKLKTKVKRHNQNLIIKLKIR